MPVFKKEKTERIRSEAEKKAEKKRILLDE